jgi:hypothetical protein
MTAHSANTGIAYTCSRQYLYNPAMGAAGGRGGGKPVLWNAVARKFASILRVEDMLSKQLASMLLSISSTLKIDAVSGLLSDYTASLPRRQLFIVTVESIFSFYGSTDSPCEPWPIFQFLNPIHSR